MWEQNKFDTAIGYFWGASLFIGALISVVLGFRKSNWSNWIEAVLIGLCVFLITGLVLSGIITLMKKSQKSE